MNDLKKAEREAQNKAKETWRRIDGDEDFTDKLGNLGDDVRDGLGNAGDDIREGIDNVGEALRRRNESTERPERR